MSRATSNSAGKPYGLQRVCRLWRMARSTVYYQRRCAQAPRAPRRRAPLGPCSDEDLTGHIRRVLSASRFHGEGYRKVWVRLRHQGIRTSKERVRRLMREHGLQAPHRVGRRLGPRAQDGTIITEAPDMMWGTDMTTTVTVSEGGASVFVAVDHCTAECVGIHAAKSGNRFEALEPVRQGVRKCFGSFGEDVASGLKLRHDHGSAYLSGDFQGEDRLPGHRELAQLREGARGQRLRRALHPHPQGEPALGADLRDGRRTAPGADGLQAAL